MEARNSLEMLVFSFYPSVANQLLNVSTPFLVILIFQPCFAKKVKILNLIGRLTIAYY